MPYSIKENYDSFDLIFSVKLSKSYPDAEVRLLRLKEEIQTAEGVALGKTFRLPA